MSRRTALVLGARENLLLSVCRALAAEGWDSVAAVARPCAALAWSRRVRRAERVAPHDAAMAAPSADLLARLDALTAEESVSLVVGADVPGELCAGAVRARRPDLLHYPAAEAATLRMLDDKWRFHEFMTARGLAVPRAWRFEAPEPPPGLPFPLVVKPLKEAGGVGVTVVRDAAALAARLALEDPPGLPAIAQEFVPGSELSLSFLADRGRLLAWSVHERAADGGLHYIRDDAAVALGRALAEACGYTGMANVDMRRDGRTGGVLAIECNPRFWGTFDYTTGLGVDYLRRGLALAEGRAPEPFAGPPTGDCPGFIAVARRLPRGTARLSPGTRAFMARKLSDPLAEARRALRRGDDLPAPRALLLSSMDALALPVLRALGERGMDAVVAGSASGRLCRVSRHCAAVERVAPDAATLAAPDETLLARLEALVRERSCGVVVPVDVPGARCAALLRPRLPGVAFFPAPEPALLDRLDDKWEFHRLLTGLGLPTPPTWLAADAAAAARLPLPLMLKPRADGFSRGVRAVFDGAARDAALSGADPFLRFPVLAQEFVDGSDVDLSFLADRGRLVAWAVQTREPGAIRFIDDDRVVAIGRRLAEATRYTGLAHVDMRYRGRDRASVEVIECNPRFWGSFSYAAALGADFLGLGLALAAGRSPAAIARSPVGLCPGLLGTFRGGGTGAGRRFLRAKLADPAPELLRTALHLLGRGDDGR